MQAKHEIDYIQEFFCCLLKNKYIKELVLYLAGQTNHIAAALGLALKSESDGAVKSSELSKNFIHVKLDCKEYSHRGSNGLRRHCWQPWSKAITGGIHQACTSFITQKFSLCIPTCFVNNSSQDAFQSLIRDIHVGAETLEFDDNNDLHIIAVPQTDEQILLLFQLNYHGSKVNIFWTDKAYALMMIMGSQRRSLALAASSMKTGFSSTTIKILNILGRVQF